MYLLVDLWTYIKVVDTPWLGGQRGMFPPQIFGFKSNESLNGNNMFFA